jgi:hypothetical protein
VNSGRRFSSAGRAALGMTTGAARPGSSVGALGTGAVRAAGGSERRVATCAVGRVFGALSRGAAGAVAGTGGRGEAPVAAFRTRLSVRLNSPRFAGGGCAAAVDGADGAASGFGVARR